MDIFRMAFQFPSANIFSFQKPAKNFTKHMISVSRKRSTIHKIQLLFTLVNLYLFTAIGYVCTIVHYQVYNGKELGKQ